ncbi:MAG: CotH kinase family protein [Desulfomicrobium sp.]|nr:CotH kinase family protein [Desulfomicrobium sp.]
MLNLRHTLLFLIYIWISSFFSYAYAALNHELEPPHFSHESGFYAEEFDLVLSHPDPEAQIYYTLDGSDPDPENLNGSTFRYKNEYAQPPATEPIGEFFYQEYKTHLYTKPLHIVDRTFEPDRMSQISTTFDEKPNYFPKPVPEVDEDGKETGRMKYLFKGTPVKAVAVALDNAQSKVVSKVYFIGDQKDFSLPIINITVPEKDLFDYDEGIFVAGQKYDQWVKDDGDVSKSPSARPVNWREKINVNISMQILDQINKIVFHLDNSYMRIHGYASRTTSIKSMRIYPKDEGILYDIFGDGNIVGNARIILRNSGNQVHDYRKTYLGDAYRHIVMGGLAFGIQRYRPINIFLNGEYYGILNVRDRLDKHYLKNMYQVEKKSIDLLKRNKIVQHGSDKQWDFFLNKLEEDVSRDGFFEEITKLFDVTSFADYYSAQIFIGNRDWPGNNIRYWRSKNKQINDVPENSTCNDGRWRWIMYDTDASSSNVMHDTLSYAASPIKNTPYNPEWSTFVLRRLLKNDIFKNYFITRFSDLLNTHFNPERTMEILEDLSKAISSDMSKHIVRWSTHKSIKEWKDHIANLSKFMQERPDYQRMHLQEFFNLDGLYSLRIDINNKDYGVVKVNTLTLGLHDIELEKPIAANVRARKMTSILAMPWQGEYFQNLPLTLEAVPAQGYRFSHWEIFGFKLTEEQKTQSKLEIVPTANLFAKAIMVKMPEIPAEEFKIISEGNFDVYLKDNQLIYASQNCSQSETETRFFLHIQPKNKDNLPQERKEYGFDNLDFSFSQGGVRLRTECVIVRKLPSYPIQRITTGQFNKDGHIWKGSYEFANNPGN